MDKLKWCFKKEQGLRMIEPNKNLAQAYLVKAEEALTSLRINTIKDWKISTAYYTIYFSLYALLMRIGIRCEIHSCTISFVQHYLASYFTPEELVFFERALETRVDAQYYVDRSVSNENYSRLIKNAPLVLAQCRSLLEQFTEKEINVLRTQVKKLLLSK